MLKRVTLLLLAVLFMNTVIAQSQKKAVRNKTDNNIVRSGSYFSRGENTETVILTEDFSKFTAGSVEDPDDLRLDDIETTMIDDKYFNSPGWSGIEIYQAGGCAYIDFSNEYNEPGLISTPLINTEGSIFIKCRMRSENPEGEIVGYNIVDESFDAVDANVDFVEVSDQWTDVSWFTTSGCNNSYIYIFSYSSNVFIDDIEIISCSIPTPTLLEETDITVNSFSANWTSIDNIDTYLFKLYAKHTASTSETFYYTNTDFSNVDSKGTIASPETSNSWSKNVNGWHIYMPVLIDEAIGITGKYSSIEQYGTLTSPVSDFSSDNGKVCLSFKAHGQIDDQLEINLITPANGYYDIASKAYITIENGGWNEYSVELTKGAKDSYIDITYFGNNDIFFDDLKLYQNIGESETKTLILEDVETKDTSYRAQIGNAYLNDVIYYQVAASQFVYGPDGENIIGAIDSKFTEEKIVTLLSDNDTTEVITELDTISIGIDSLQTSYAPISNYGNSANFSVSQQIYTKEEINKESGAITSISFQNKIGKANNRTLVVYMSNTTQEAYRDNKDWVLVKDSEAVFTGEHKFGTDGEWTTITLDKPFVYTGGNIAITIYDKSDLPLGYNSGHDTFSATPTDTLRGLYRTSTEKINVFNLEEAYGFELKTSIYTTPANQYYVNNIKFEIGPYNGGNDGSDETVSLSEPKNVSANVIDSTSIRISWTDVKNATSYKVYRDGNEIANVTETYYLDEKLEDSVKYCYTVTALNGNLESDKSEEVCAITFVDNTDTPDNPDTPEDPEDSVEELTSLFNIYPNPVESELFLATELRVEEVSIYDIYGRMTTAYGLQTTDIVHSVNVSDLESGVYFVKIVTSEGEIVKRFVKK